MFPLELEKLRSQVLLEVLPKELVFRTPYLNFISELKMILRQTKAILDEDSVYRNSIKAVVERRGFRPISWVKGLPTRRIFYLVDSRGVWGVRCSLSSQYLCFLSTPSPSSSQSPIPSP
jgi:hypothetical protein